MPAYTHPPKILLQFSFGITSYGCLHTQPARQCFKYQLVLFFSFESSWHISYHHFTNLPSQTSKLRQKQILPHPRGLFYVCTSILPTNSNLGMFNSMHISMDVASKWVFSFSRYHSKYGNHHSRMNIERLTRRNKNKLSAYVVLRSTHSCKMPADGRHSGLVGREFIQSTFNYCELIRERTQHFP